MIRLVDLIPLVLMVIGEVYVVTGSRLLAAPRMIAVWILRRSGLSFIDSLVVCPPCHGTWVAGGLAFALGYGPWAIVQLMLSTCAVAAVLRSYLSDPTIDEAVAAFDARLKGKREEE